MSARHPRSPPLSRLCFFSTPSPAGRTCCCHASLCGRFRSTASTVSAAVSLSRPSPSVSTQPVSAWLGPGLTRSGSAQLDPCRLPIRFSAAAVPSCPVPEDDPRAEETNNDETRVTDERDPSLPPPPPLPPPPRRCVSHLPPHHVRPLSPPSPPPPSKLPPRISSRSCRLLFRPRRRGRSGHQRDGLSWRRGSAPGDRRPLDAHLAGTAGETPADSVSVSEPTETDAPCE